MKKIFLAAVCMFMTMGAMAQGTVKCFIDDFTIAPGESKTISVNLTNPDNKFTAFQFDLQLPAGVEIALNKKGKIDATLNEDRIEDQTMNVKLNGSTYTFIAFSLTNSDFYLTEGAIVNMTVTAAADATVGAATGKIANAKFTPKTGESVTFAEVPFNVTIGEGTGISSINAEENGAAVYNLAGQKMSKAQKGLFIKNGKKFIVK